jgi:hypothetical protein
MNSQTSKYFDGKNIMGYLYFTDNPIEACEAGLTTYLTDIRIRDFEHRHIYDSDPSSRDSIVIAFKTSAMAKNIEIDPEYFSVHKPNEELRKQTGKPVINSTWYRHKGNIPAKYLFSYKTLEFSKWPKDLVNLLMLNLIIVKMRDDGIPEEQIKSMVTKAIHNRLAKDPPKNVEEQTVG